MVDLKIKLKNSTNGIKYVTSLLKDYKENDKVENIDILNLLSYHPTKHIKKDDIDYLCMRNRKPYNKLALHYKYKNSDIIDDISYRCCVENLFGKFKPDKWYTDDVIKAFRYESHIGSKKQYFIKKLLS